MRQTLGSSRCEITGMLGISLSHIHGNKNELASVQQLAPDAFRFVVSRLEEGPTTDYYLWVRHRTAEVVPFRDLLHGYLATHLMEPTKISESDFGEANWFQRRCDPGDLPALASKEVWPKKKTSEWSPFDVPSPHSTAPYYATITSGSTYTTEVKSGLILRVHHGGEDIRTGSGDYISWTGNLPGATDLGWPRGRTCGRRQLAAMESASMCTATHTLLNLSEMESFIYGQARVFPTTFLVETPFLWVGSV
jgi:hypothetical protein